VNQIEKGANLGDQLRDHHRFGTVGTFVGSPGGPLDLATSIGGLVLDPAIGGHRAHVDAGGAFGIENKDNCGAKRLAPI
jgi:hypothetical protein